MMLAIVLVPLHSYAAHPLWTCLPINDMLNVHSHPGLATIQATKPSRLLLDRFVANRCRRCYFIIELALGV